MESAALAARVSAAGTGGGRDPQGLPGTGKDQAPGRGPNRASAETLGWASSLFVRKRLILARLKIGAAALRYDRVRDAKYFSTRPARGVAA